MKAMIFAAGLGTRLRPITDTMPKALVRVCGEPLLAHVIRKLRDAGYEELVVNVHHFPEQIRDYLDGHDFGIPVRISDESDRLLETGGAVAHARKLLQPLGEPFLLHNVDIVSNLDIAWFRAQTRPEALATLLVSERDSRRRLLFDEGLRLVGWTDLATGEVRSPYRGLKVQNCFQYAFAGIHNLSPRIFEAFDAMSMPARFAIIDFYLSACARYRIYGAPAKDLTLTDVGKIECLADAERLCATLLAAPPSPSRADGR